MQGEREKKFWLELSSWGRLKPYILRNMGTISMSTVFNIIIIAVDLAVPLFLSYAIDNFIANNSLDGIVMYTVLYFLVIVIQALAMAGWGYVSMKLDMNFSTMLRRDCFVRLQKLPISYYNKTPVGTIIASVMNNCTRVSEVIAWNCADIVWGILYILGMFVVMFFLQARLAFMVMLLVPAMIAVSAIFQRILLVLNREVRTTNTMATTAYNEGIAGARTSKILAIEDKNLEDFKAISDSLRRKTHRHAVVNGIFIPLVVFIGSMLVGIVLVNGGYMSIEGLLDLGVLSVFLSYAVNLLEPVQSMATMIGELISAQASLEKVLTILNEPCTIADTPEVEEKYGDIFGSGGIHFERIRGDIEFKNVYFRYDDSSDYIYEDFSLKIPAGTNVALVGETGAGKSTLVNLVCRFFEPTSGQILIDGVDYRERSILYLQSQLGYVLQTPYLFSGTVRENIAYGKLDATDDEIEAAAKLVCADRVIHRLENGYDTDVGEGGDRLSTGEKQLISFARSVIADPPIFVLDEATSSIDTDTELLIREAIANTLKGRTSFLIAHRMSTIRHADLILVVKGGKIVESGTHDELIKNGGYYCKLCRGTRLEE